MGIVTQSIGTASRNFSTIQAWEDALPANLVTDGNSYVGECYNDSEFAVSTGSILVFGGETTDATHTITLKCHAGQSFRDNASVQSNALRYNQSNGVGLRYTANYGAKLIDNSPSSIKYISIDGLQVCNDGNAGGVNAGVLSAGSIADLAGGGMQVSNCLFQSTGASAVAVQFASGGSFTNSVIIQKATAGTQSAAINIGRTIGDFKMANCTLVYPSDITASLAAGISTQSGYASRAASITNCAVFGFTAFIDNTATVIGSNNATDKTSVGFGTSNQVSLTYTSQFQSTLTASLDLRAKTGAGLLDNGATDTTDIPGAIDIAGTSRPQGTAWDIGAWELVVAGGFTPKYRKTLSSLGTRIGGRQSQVA